MTTGCEGPDSRSSFVPTTTRSSRRTSTTPLPLGAGSVGLVTGSLASRGRCSSSWRGLRVPPRGLRASARGHIPRHVGRPTSGRDHLELPWFSCRRVDGPVWLNPRGANATPMFAKRTTVATWSGTAGPEGLWPRGGGRASLREGTTDPGGRIFPATSTSGGRVGA